MICEIITKKGEAGSGGGREAFGAGVRYICGKASRFELRNLTSQCWTTAAEEMVLTSELSRKVQKPYYHLALSWHETERPTTAQMIAAMERMLLALGLAEHQVVIATHDDTPRCHVHAVVNLVQALTGKVWSKSNDRIKAERACRKIELQMGWPHDRGHYDFAVEEVAGQKDVKLVKKSAEHFAEIARAREAGRRKKTASQIKTEKRTGIEVFDHAIPAALTVKLGQAVDACRTWPEVHAAFNSLGLRYERFGSGARIHLGGSTEFAKASSFGARFSIARLEKGFGPFEPATPQPQPHAVTVPPCPHGLTGTPAPADEKMLKAAAFKTTLLRRIYTEIHIEPRVAREIRFVDLAGQPPKITFRSGAIILDKGRELSTSASSPETRATMIAMAKAKGWSTVRPTGNADYVRNISLEAAQAGLRVAGVPAEIQAEADRIFARQKPAHPLERAEREAQKAHLSEQADREAAVQQNAEHRAQVVALKREVAEAVADKRAVLDASNDPAAKSKKRDIAAIEARALASLPDARRAPSPQPAPDAAPHGAAEARRIRRTVLENSREELQQLKRLDIGLIATSGGWSDMSRSHRDSSDKAGKRFRIYQRGGDTIKCTLKPDGRWLWVSNRTGESGTVFDLWQRDNPGRSLGHAREALRAMAGTAPVVAPAEAASPPTAPDHTAVRQRWEAAARITTRTNYADERGISKATLARFATEVRCGAFGGIYFAHRDVKTGTILGFEQRWERNGEKNQARFAKGGRKSVAVLGDPQSARRLVVVESGLDALALAELENRTDTLYASTGGGFGPATERALAQLAQGRELFSGFDNDRAGEALHAHLAVIIPATRRLAPPSQVRGSEASCKDWLDVLNALKDARAARRVSAKLANAAARDETDEAPRLQMPGGDWRPG